MECKQQVTKSALGRSRQGVTTQERYRPTGALLGQRGWSCDDPLVRRLVKICPRLHLHRVVAEACNRSPARIKWETQTVARSQAAGSQGDGAKAASSELAGVAPSSVSAKQPVGWSRSMLARSASWCIFVPSFKTVPAHPTKPLSAYENKSTQCVVKAGQTILRRWD